MIALHLRQKKRSCQDTERASMSWFRVGARRARFTRTLPQGCCRKASATRSIAPKEGTFRHGLCTRELSEITS